MEWTTTKPTENGHYWFKQGIVSGLVRVTNNGERMKWEGRVTEIKHLQGEEWYGPLQLPPPNKVPIPPEVREARLAGYDGTPCPKCKQLKVVSAGGMWKCDSCGARND
jgi:hypothetical protein